MAPLPLEVPPFEEPPLANGESGAELDASPATTAALSLAVSSRTHSDTLTIPATAVSLVSLSFASLGVANGAWRRSVAQLLPPPGRLGMLLSGTGASKLISALDTSAEGEEASNGAPPLGAALAAAARVAAVRCT